jgi:hypothetical protein
MPTWYVYIAPDCVTVQAPDALTALQLGQQQHMAALDAGTLETRVYDEAREYWHANPNYPARKDTPTDGS